MTSKETWNYLVDHYNRNIGANEDVIQRDWESFFADAELFRYSKIRGDVDSHRTLQIGSYERVIPDIILKKGGNDLFVVELKKYSLHFSKEREAQLFSYLKLLHISIGVLVCDKIYIYVYDFETSEQENKLEIPFEKDNADGIALVELLTKDYFSKEKIYEFISGKKSFDKNVRDIKNQINNDLILNLLRKHFTDTYTTEEIEVALRDCSLSCEHTIHASTPEIKPTIHTGTTTVHKTRTGIKATPTKQTGIVYDIYDEPDFDYVIIKTTPNRVAECGGDLYEATRFAWRAGERIHNYKYVISVVDKVVKAVYVVDYWRMVTGDHCKGRYEFFGKPAAGPVVDKLLNKVIPEKYRRPGMASPVVYKK